MIPLSYFGVSSKQVASHPVDAWKIEGTFVGNTASWIQVHDTQLAPAGGSVPLKSVYVAVGSTTPQPFKLDFIGSELTLKNGLFVGVSSTEGTYTAAALNMDLEVELKLPERPAINNVFGDLTTAVNYLQVWSEANGARFLCKVDVTSNDGTDPALYLLLFAKNQANISVGDKPIWHSPQLDVDGTQDTFQFGDRGLIPHQQDANGTARYGCTLIFSSSPATYQTPTNNPGTIRAETKSLVNP